MQPIDFLIINRAIREKEKRDENHILKVVLLFAAILLLFTVSMFI